MILTCKYLFDNRYVDRPTVWDGIMRTTNLIGAAGKNVVVAGCGWCGKGVAMRAVVWRHVFYTEVDPIKAIEAVFDGFTVLPMIEAAKNR